MTGTVVLDSGALVAVDRRGRHADVVLLAHDGDRILTSDSDDIDHLVEASQRQVRVVPV